MIKAIALGSMALGAVAVGAAYVWSTSSVETPTYTVQVTNGDIELRNYPAMTLAQVTRSGSRRSAVQAGFSPLARYIFAKDRTGEKIAMTAPVVQSQLNDEWTVSFILPAAITADSAPTPASDVQVVSQPERLVAAIRFSGSWSDARFQNASQRLLAWVEEQGFGIDGAVEYGYYNDPFTPAFLRRNEVLVPVRAR
ncbi:MAG: heme-binding protein, partial [Pseudomonadota bacterium]